MPVYMILDAAVHDGEPENAAAYQSYKEAAPEYVYRHGGEYLCRGGAVDVVAGDWRPERVVMIKFPSREAYDTFMADPDYKPWKELRESLSTIKNMVVLEGI
ncbi:MAG: DUF1330 domain-containing protein [Alphaproteobacteria bacterium]|nr:DUF1330 domain-containing protein [Alphaproteobacteria bacterium]